MRGRLATIGYTQTNARERIDAFVGRPRSYLVDIRSKPYSWNKSWNREVLRARYGRRYVHVPGLGNVNSGHKGAPIRLSDPEPWVSHFAGELQRGNSFLLLCGCRDYERCHRKLVYTLIRAALGDSREPEHGQTPARVVCSTQSLWEGW